MTEDLKYYRLAQGVIASVKLHHDDVEDVAKYLKQYVIFKKGF